MMRTRCFFESIHSGADCKRRIRYLCQSTVRTVNLVHGNAVAVWIQHKQKFSQPVNRDQTALEPVRKRHAGQNSQRIVLSLLYPRTADVLAVTEPDPYTRCCVAVGANAAGMISSNAAAAATATQTKKDAKARIQRARDLP